MNFLHEIYKISQQPENCENRNDPDLVQAFPKKWWVESDFKAPNLPLSLRFKGSGCQYIHTDLLIYPYGSGKIFIWPCHTDQLDYLIKVLRTGCFCIGLGIDFRKSKKDRQHNGQAKKDKRTNNDLQNIHIKLKIDKTPINLA
jgi:hypothetical protein